MKTALVCLALAMLGFMAGVLMWDYSVSSSREPDVVPNLAWFQRQNRIAEGQRKQLETAHQAVLKAELTGFPPSGAEQASLVEIRNGLALLCERTTGEYNDQADGNESFLRSNGLPVTISCRPSSAGR